MNWKMQQEIAKLLNAEREEVSPTKPYLERKGKLRVGVKDEARMQR